jgi:hypothetical protein
MPLFLVLAILNIVLIVHAAKTGRFQPWFWIILMVPVLGAVAYVVVELVPEWFGSTGGQRARRRLVSTVDPNRNYRQWRDQLDALDSIANRARLAEECLDLGKYQEAREHFDVILVRPTGREPIYYLGRARAEFGLGQPQETVATLDELRRHFPDYHSPEGHLLYARALEAAGRVEEALEDYAAVAEYYPGAEARVRFALLLQKLGRDVDAQKLLRDLLAQMRRAPKYVRKMQAQWIDLAEQAARAK